MSGRLCLLKKKKNKPKNTENIVLCILYFKCKAHSPYSLDFTLTRGKYISKDVFCFFFQKIKPKKKLISMMKLTNSKDNFIFLIDFNEGIVCFNDRMRNSMNEKLG